MKKIIILGSTGSIGKQTIEVIRGLGRDFKIMGLTTYSNISAIKSQILEFNPEVVSIEKQDLFDALNNWCRKNKLNTKVFSGQEGLIKVAKYKEADLVLSAIVGFSGLKPLFEAIRNKKNIALANKEALVVAGQLIIEEAKKNKVQIIPVDSEHSAIFQCIKNENTNSIQKIILTASGGPFYRSIKKHSLITVDDALAHPTWSMGQKITIDSATLMNKGLEAIEAHYLFNIPFDKIDILIHPQSIVHSMVNFVDGSVLAQLSWPDMRLPIQYALTYPNRYTSEINTLDLIKAKQLEFDKPDFKRFKCLKLALDAGKKGGTMPAVMNAANEIAVEYFLRKKIDFTMIPTIIGKVMESHKNINRPDLDDIINADKIAREKALKTADNLKLKSFTMGG